MTAPRTGGGGTSARPLRSSGADDAAGDIAAVYVRSLIRSQLRLAVTVAIGFAVATVLFVLAIAFVPGLDDAYLAGVPVSWVLLGAGVYPLAITVGALYLRAAGRNEARYRSLAEDE
ncbi:DUF485 domain-containing protein [Agromyces sp. SYSU K20354]|uniref:DUF485 domain-containing protein n=1 Tax=Agromyces cavernae TaxID=2898659 RepID=UPI001E420ED1|nr:DUF485 domain-containing protein [Agromyces cavernae]MCD2441194.1 DUF485 domain-containing protein [Agromyces cavernae]